MISSSAYQKGILSNWGKQACISAMHLTVEIMNLTDKQYEKHRVIASLCERART